MNSIEYDDINDGNRIIWSNQSSINSSLNEEIDEQDKISLCGKKFNLTKKQFITITLLSTFYLLASSYYSLLAPFLPSEALKKNVSQTKVGIIFGIFELVIILLSPVFGKYLEAIGVRFLFLSGLFLCSSTEILFGFLDYCPPGNIYFVMAVLCRVVTAVGASMGLSYAIIGHYFPNKISSLVAMLEVFTGIGLMIGPVLGGFLFQIGGFTLPFFVMGGLQFCMFIVAFFIFPDIESTSTNRTEPIRVLPLLKIPRFLVTLLVAFVSSLSIGFLQPCLELHLAPLKLTPVELGLILLFPSLLYIIASPIVGYLTDKHPGLAPFCMFFSGILTASSYIFLGPIPWLNLPLKLWIFMVGFIIYGLFLGGLVVPSYSQLVKISKNNGYQDNLALQGVLSGIFSSIWSGGALVGPILGGAVVDRIGFELASFGVFLLMSFCILLYGFVHLVTKNSQIHFDNQFEREPLLN